MAISKELLDELLKNYEKPEDLLGENGLLKELNKALLERTLQGELTHHLGYEKNERKSKKATNSRNGKNKKKLKTDLGEIEVEIPRDREATFEPQIIQKHQTRFDGFNDKIISMYSRGMTTREIQGHLKDIYNIEVSPDFISTVTDSVMEGVKEWQERPLDPVYPIIYLDALRVKVRDEGQIVNKAVD